MKKSHRIILSIIASVIISLTFGPFGLLLTIPIYYIIKKLLTWI
jgi:predicted PurR-regulated permease PerM